MEVKLVGNLTYSTILRHIDNAGLDVHSPPRGISFDFSLLGFVEPSGVVMLHNLCSYLTLQGCSVYLANCDADRAGLQYLDGTGFFQDSIGKKVFPYSSLKQTTMPLQKVRTADVAGWVPNHLIPWFQSCSGRPRSSLAHFGFCVSELFNNIQNHSSFEVGSFFAQWFPNINTLRMVIGDFGRGIPVNVATIDPQLSGAKAIMRSFDDGFSSHSTPKNRGAGLHFLRNNVCLSLGGEMYVYSGGAAVHAASDGQLMEIALSVGNSGYTGTLFDIKIPTGGITEDPTGEEDFEW